MMTHLCIIGFFLTLGIVERILIALLLIAVGAAIGLAIKKVSLKLGVGAICAGIYVVCEFISTVVLQRHLTALPYLCLGGAALGVAIGCFLICAVQSILLKR